MPASKKIVRPAKKSPTTQPPVSKKGQVARQVRRPYDAVRRRTRDLLNRRPHRSFRRTRRRDYVRSLKLPGYWSLTNQVRRLLWQNKKLFILLALTYAVVSALLVGIGSQSTYSQLADTLRSTSGDIFKGNWGEIGKASLLLTTALSGNLNGTLTDVQKVYAAVIGLLVWLTSVWLLRALLAGKRPRLRDGLYNAGAPILSTLFVSALLVVQLLPIALAAIALGAALQTGFLDSGAIAMIFWVIAVLLTVLSLYWITSTFFALVIVTLPGMYPMRAIKTAGDLVIGRRIRLLYRIIWLLLSIVVAWAFVMIPIILLDAWIKGVWQAVGPVPIVPLALLLMSSVSIVWSAAYIYMLYRKVVDDDAAPA